ncbi:MAG: BON domain-containing protein [Gemmatimonadaceae bacterium]
MSNREHGQGYRAGQYDRDYESGTFERGDPYDRWERNRERGEFAAGGAEYSRGRPGDWSERGYRGGWRDGGYGEDWLGGRPFGGGRMRNEQSYYERGGFFGGKYGRDDIYDREMYGRRSLAPDWTPDRDYGYGAGSYGGYDDYGAWSGAYGPHGPSSVRGYAGYGPEHGYGPSIGYGYGPAGTYLGGREYASLGRPLRRPNFAGRGPRGYRRSDERIREEVNERLARHPDLDATDIDVRVSDAGVVLLGVVEDRRAKRLAEDIVEEVWGIDDVRNELKVRRGFLAAFTGERADEREVERPTAREMAGESMRTSARPTPGASGTSTGT